MRHFLAFVTCICSMLIAAASYGQPAPLRLKQEHDGMSLAVLTASELAALGDPLFNLLLKDKADLVKLADVEAAIQPDASRRHLFVVEERIVSSAKVGGRRAVITFSGSNGGQNLDGNVMLSVGFAPPGISDIVDIEAWGWDDHRQRYNYYKLDAVGSISGGLTWKFRVSSERAEQISETDRRGTCLACHVVGAPVMKELFFPWNNWHAGAGATFQADYLDPASFAMGKWPAATTPEFQRLTQANVLEEDVLMPALRRFNRSRLNSALKRDAATGNLSVNAAGKMTVMESRRLLRPLFETTDVNLYSSRDTSGIHPFGKATDFVASKAIRLPVDQFFLNTDLIGGGSEGGVDGLRLASGRGFSGFTTLTQQENKNLVTKFHVQVNNVSGDTHFAWIVPGASFGNNDLLDQCLQMGVVTPHFLAAALAVDLENPVFSTKRAALSAFLPDQFDFMPVATGVDPTILPRDAVNDLLTKAVIAKIDAASPAAGSSEDEFRSLLKSNDAVKELDQRVNAYVARVKANLDTAPANAAKRKAELERLFEVVINRRKAMEAHPILKNLDETNGQLLLPLPPTMP